MSHSSRKSRVLRTHSAAPAVVAPERVIAPVVRQLPASVELGTPLSNRILAGVPAPEFKRFRKALQPVWLLVGEAASCGGHAPYALFPVSAIISLQVVLDSSAVEFASVGNEGCVSLGLHPSVGNLPCRGVVQAGGLAYRLPNERLLAELELDGYLPRVLSRYSAALVTQSAMTAACNRRHTLEQQLARWFLLALDRLPGNEMLVTHELIAEILGVRREGVTEVAGRFQRAGIIEYRRGHVTVLRRDRLLAAACECYGVIRAGFDRAHA